MKKITLLGCVVAGVLLLFVSCTTNKLSANVSSSGDKTVITRWQGMEAGLEARPKWIKDMAIGKQSSFKKEYGDEIGNDEVLPLVITHAPTVDEAEALAFAEVDLEFARSLSTKVNALAGETLTDGQKTAILQEASSIKADFTGMRKIVSFWLEVESEKPGELFEQSGNNREVIYYYVCAVPRATYEIITKTYLLKFMQSSGLDEETKKALYSMKDGLLISDSSKTEQQKQKEAEAHQDYIEKLKSGKIISPSQAAKNLDEALKATATLYGF